MGNLMGKDSQTNTGKRQAFTDASEFDLTWNASSVQEFTEGKIVRHDEMIAYKVDQNKWVGGVKTDEIESVPYVHIQIGKQTKPAKLNAKTLASLKSAFGNDPEKWVNKTVVSKHEEAFGKPYLVFAAKGKLG